MLRFSLLWVALATPFLVSATHNTSRLEPKTAAGVLAASDDWIAAERLGQVAKVNARLSDNYRDVESNGRAHPKADLLKHTATRKDIWPGTAADVVKAFHEKYPSMKTVVMEGDMAILSYHRMDPKLQGYIIAEDIFTYRNGMWRGILSNHFNVPAASGS